MKSAFSLPLLIALGTLSACTTLSNRRDLYTQKQADGPYTRQLHGEGKVASMHPIEPPVTPAPAPAPVPTN